MREGEREGEEGGINKYGKTSKQELENGMVPSGQERECYGIMF